MASTFHEHVTATKQSKGIALIEHLGQPETAAADKTGHQLPAAVFLTKTHFEIFGLFFPGALPDLASAITLVSDLYLHVNVTMSLDPSIKTVSTSRGAAVTWPQVWQREIDTLTRHVTSSVTARSHRMRCVAAPRDTARQRIRCERTFTRLKSVAIIASDTTWRS